MLFKLVLLIVIVVLLGSGLTAICFSDNLNAAILNLAFDVALLALFLRLLGGLVVQQLSVLFWQPGVSDCVTGQITSLPRRNVDRCQRSSIRLPNKPDTRSSRSSASRVYSYRHIAVH